jgi:hypothetical protein
MNPLATTDSRGIRHPIHEESKEAFKNKIDTLYTHFVEKGGWVDANTVALLPKKNKLIHLLDNILTLVKYKVFGIPPAAQQPLEGLRGGLSSYIEVNEEWLGSSRENLDKDMIIKIMNIQRTMHKRNTESFLKKYANFDSVVPGMHPALMLAELIDNKVNKVAQEKWGQNADQMCEKLGLNKDPRLLGP